MPQLAPSEVVVLFGDRFAKEAGMLTTRHESFVSGKKVGNEDVTVAALSAAFLAAEQAGAIRLHIEQRKMVFGLIKTEVLRAEPGSGAEPWPEGTLEARIVHEVMHKPADVDDVVAEVIGEDKHSDPAKFLLDLGRMALATRDVLHAEEETHLKFFKHLKFVLPPDVAAQLDAAEAERVHAMLEAAEHARPELYKKLVKSIKGGIALRRETDSDSGGD